MRIVAFIEQPAVIDRITDSMIQSSGSLTEPPSMRADLSSPRMPGRTLPMGRGTPLVPVGAGGFVSPSSRQAALSNLLIRADRVLEVRHHILRSQTEL